MASFVVPEVTNRRETSIDQVRQKCHVLDTSLRSNSSYSKPFDSSFWQVLLRRKLQEISGIQPSLLLPKSNSTTRMQQSFLSIHDPWNFVMLWHSTPCSMTTATLSRAIVMHDNGDATNSSGIIDSRALTFTASLQNCDRK